MSAPRRALVLYRHAVLAWDGKMALHWWREYHARRRLREPRSGRGAW